MNRTSLDVASLDAAGPDPVAGDLAATASWLERIDHLSHSLHRLPGLAAALHWLGLQLAGPLAASRFQVWQIHDWRDGAGLIQPWLACDDQAGVQRIDLAQLDLLREGEGALGLALSGGRAAVAPVRAPAVGARGQAATQGSTPAGANAAGPGAAPAVNSARLCLAVGLHDPSGEPFAALEWWLGAAPPDDALPALTMLARLVAARASGWANHPMGGSRDAPVATVPADVEGLPAAEATQPVRGALDPGHEMAMAMAAVLPVSLVLLDTDLNVLLVNRHAQHEFGLLPEQASGQGLAQLFGAAAGQDLAAGAAQSSARGGPVEQQLVFATRHGTRRVLARSSALRDGNGQVRLLLCRLQPSGREQAQLAGLGELASPVVGGPQEVGRAVPWRGADESARGEARDAPVASAASARPVSVPPGLASARATSVRLAPRHEAAVAPGRFTPEAPPEVLVIDDHAVNQELMTQMLVHLGCRARCAGSAEQGLAELCSRPVDLVLMDIRMPGMDGLQALAWIRQGPSERYHLRVAPTVPVVAVTAHAVAGDADRCLEHGFDAYLAKPCRLDDLRQVLAGLLAWRAAPATADASGSSPGGSPHGKPEPTPPAGKSNAPDHELPAQAGQGASRADSTPGLGDGMPVFDRQALLRLQALDPSGQNQLLVRVMKAFELSLQRLSSQLRTARQQHDAQTVRQAAHTLKSSSASVGAMRLSGLCLEVESVLRRAGASFDHTPAASSEALGTSVDRLLDEIERVQVELPRWMDAGAMPVPAARSGVASGSGA